ncbi:hypothetical protein ACFLEY_21975 [Bradyrhizobium sp. YCK136]|uniref:hypothetical protein n=1 Tax=Bradyrhizobium sp. YCK136 TaxID=3351346 RepID=UPI0037C884BA
MTAAVNLPNGVTLADLDAFEKAVDTIVDVSHRLAKHWWIDPRTGEDLRKNPLIVPTKLLLTVSEICEAMEGDRKDAMDDHLPQFPAFATELGDAIIRIGDLAGAVSAKVGSAAKAKLLYNATRPDHKAENRVKKGGKKY